MCAGVPTGARGRRPHRRSALVEQTATRVLEGPELERVVEQALESPAMERVVGRVIESRLLDEAVERLLESEELWVLVRGSPAARR